MKRLHLTASLVAALTLIACSSTETDSPSAPSTRTAGVAPSTRKTTTKDNYHGTEIADPYRWLEDQDSAEVLAWADTQNAHTEAYISRSDSRDDIRQRLTELWDFERRTALARHGDAFYYSRNNGLQNQSVLYRTTDPQQPGSVLLDPNKLSDDGTIALGSLSFSEDGKLLAYSYSKSGSDWRAWRVLNTVTGETLSDHLEWTKFTNATWMKDGSGFFYQRYPAPGEGKVYEATNRTPQLCFHAIGTEQSKDKVIYERPDQPKWGYATSLSDDGTFLVISAWVGTDRRNRVLWLDLKQPDAMVRPLLMDFDASYTFLGNDQHQGYFLTDNEAPRRRIIAVDLDKPESSNWRQIIDQGPDKIEFAPLFQSQFLVTTLHNAAHQVTRFSTAGKRLGTVPLPGVGTLGEITGKRTDKETWFSFASFTRPSTNYHYTLTAKAPEISFAPELAYDPDDFTVTQVAYQSADGETCSMFLVHKKDLELNGNNPTYLYGYGGFDIALTPRFSVENIVWLERGGVFAQAILRGGGEYGEDWHRAGMLEKKQNVFDDFTAAAQYLTRNDYTRREKLAIGGRSNGGLLVGACLTQHPELYGAAIPEVGVLDMLRFHGFTIGWAWVSEYGSSADKEMFPILRAYSPLHNIDPTKTFPPTLIMTGDHDDRVLPGHSYKFAATLQEAQDGKAPIFLRVARKSGHGSGKPTAMKIAEAADRWAFLGRALKLD